MSYARWGCDKSEVYVYEAEDGFNIHVATDSDLDSVEASETACADRLEWLRRERKVVVPQYAINNLRAEAK